MALVQDVLWVVLTPTVRSSCPGRREPHFVNCTVGATAHHLRKLDKMTLLAVKPTLAKVRKGMKLCSGGADTEREIGLRAKQEQSPCEQK
eukprot:3529288-Pleurochrysis_carterae.AAC.1